MTLQRKNIVLTGMPACGKSTVGIILAKTLGFNFLDTDLLIQQSEGRLLQDIIDRDGISNFLQIEEAVLRDIEIKNTVIATGGSAVYSQISMENLKNNGIIVYIRLRLDSVENRLSNIRTRGIAMNPGDSLSSIYHKRIPLYEKYADITVDGDDKTPEKVMEEIAEALYKLF